jgi:hypothetical protein
MLRLGFDGGDLCFCEVSCCGVCVDSLRGMIGGLAEGHCCVTDSRDVVFVFESEDRGFIGVLVGLDLQISLSGCRDCCWTTRNARDARSHDQPDSSVGYPDSFGGKKL